MNWKYWICLILGTTFTLPGAAQKDVRKAFDFAQAQARLMLREVDSAKAKADKPNLVEPRTLNAKGELVLVNSRDWCSGFFPGELWYLYEYSRKPEWLAAAKQYTAAIEQEQFTKTTHDLGFEIYCSAGNAYRLTKDPHYKDVIINAAKSLSTRFNPAVGCIKSWDGRREWGFPVIIDNMMNLELLFEATRFSGDSSFYHIAVTHANTTLKNHFRKDHSSYHVVDYDPLTGKVLHRQTHQGYADESSWARGQAWGLYGYTLCYRETRNPVYLQQAQYIAAYILHHPQLPKDQVPYWDYSVPNKTGEPRDASAAAITASALYELSTYSGRQGSTYRTAADEILKSLTQHYQTDAGTSRGFLLLHSTGHKPAKSEIDVPLIYADYYYLEALLRKHGQKASS